jgi:hypothetical protein
MLKFLSLTRLSRQLQRREIADNPKKMALKSVLSRFKTENEKII